jgi:hypothetical protein
MNIDIFPANPGLKLDIRQTSARKFSTLVIEFSLSLFCEQEMRYS